MCTLGSEFRKDNLLSVEERAWRMPHFQLGDTCEVRHGMCDTHGQQTNIRKQERLKPRET
jgi:hypothetical protein